MVDILIVGGGLAGLAAAEACKKQGYSFHVLEAAPTPGGRCHTTRSAAGTRVEEGANWVHSRDKGEVNARLAASGLAYDPTDTGTNISCIYQGNEHGAEFVEQMKSSKINLLRAAAAKYLHWDRPMPDLIKGEDAQLLGNFLSKHWVGIEAQNYSAAEFVSDPYEPGGYQIHQGYGALVEDMLAKVGTEHLECNRPVLAIRDGHSGVSATTKDGEIYTAKKLIFTGSVGVLQSGRVNFQSPMADEDTLNRQVRQAVEPLMMGHLTKTIFDIDPAWVAAHPDCVNRGLMLFDEPQIFAHVASVGKPVITIFFGGEAGREAEALPADVLRARAIESISKFKDFHDIGEVLLPHPPVVTHWNENPWTVGAYSAVKIGGERSGPVPIGKNILLAGEAFDEELASYADGALRSGARAAERHIQELKRRERSPAGRQGHGY